MLLFLTKFCFSSNKALVCVIKHFYGNKDLRIWL